MPTSQNWLDIPEGKTEWYSKDPDKEAEAKSFLSGKTEDFSGNFFSDTGESGTDSWDPWAGDQNVSHFGPKSSSWTDTLIDNPGGRPRVERHYESSQDSKSDNRDSDWTVNNEGKPLFTGSRSSTFSPSDSEGLSPRAASMYRRAGLDPHTDPRSERQFDVRNRVTAFTGATPEDQGSVGESRFASGPSIVNRFRQGFNNFRDTITPSAYEYGGNIAKSAFQGGEQVNRTDFKDSDVVSLFERTDAGQVPRTTGAKTRFSDTKVYENEEGVLVPHTEETLKQFPPNARGLVYDDMSTPSLGVLENIPGVTEVKDAGAAIRYGYANPLGVRGEGYVEINQPNQFESPTAIYKDAAYLNLKSDDPTETAGGQGLIGRAISNLTGNKSDILGTEYARAELPYEKWSPEMRAEYGFPSFGDSLELAEQGGYNELPSVSNRVDEFVDSLGNIKRGTKTTATGQAVSKDVPTTLEQQASILPSEVGQIASTKTGGLRDVRNNPKLKIPAGGGNTIPSAANRELEILNYERQLEGLSPLGATNQPATVDLNSSKSGWGPGSDPAVAASDKAITDAEAAWKIASNNQQNYLGGRTAGTQEEFEEYLRLQSLSDAAHKRLDAAYAQQAEAMKNYTSS